MQSKKNISMSMRARCLDFFLITFHTYSNEDRAANKQERMK